MGVVGMVNKTSSSCKHCMLPLRRLILRSMRYNFRAFATYLNTKKNGLADSLSCLQFDHFKALAGEKMKKSLEKLPVDLWPAARLWNDRI